MPPKTSAIADDRKVKIENYSNAFERVDDAQQGTLFDLEADWKKTWTGMPEFHQDNLESWQAVKVHFKTRADRDEFAKLIGQRLTERTRSIWHPQAKIERMVDKVYEADEAKNPRYPVYIISKGRADTRLTAKSLEAIGVPYRIVIEPQEYDAYAAVIDPAKILVLPFSNLGQGSIPARNWVWEHSISEGHKRHWIMDDNIDGFYRLHKNLKTPVGDGTIFRAAEDFSDRHANVAQSGLNYFMFATRKSHAIKPYTLNTRIYSCILNRNDIPFRWRGRYNEDTDLSIRILKAGYATVLFNAFLAMKTTTMTMKGGNTDQLYQGDGRLQMAQSLKDQHPEIVQITWKWGRWQHHVDYRGFARNPLGEIVEPVEDGVNNYGMSLYKIIEEEEVIPEESETGALLMPYICDGFDCANDEEEEHVCSSANCDCICGDSYNEH